MMVLGIDEFAGKRKVFGGVIIPFANTDCRKLFQFSHADFDRTPMGFCQPWIKHRHHRNRLLSRTLEIVETDRMGIVPGSQLTVINRIQILLKQRKDRRIDCFALQSELFRQTAGPNADYAIMLAVIIIVGKMLLIKVSTFSTCGFDFCRCKQKFLSTHTLQ